MTQEFDHIGPGETPNRPQPEPAEERFRALDPRVVRVWQIGYGVGFGVALVVLLFGALVTAVASPAIGITLVVAVLVAAALAAGFVAWYPARAHRAWGYHVDSRVLETRRGVVVQIAQLIPLSRLQHVDLHRGPVERAFGLASLVLHTAGTRDASLRIPGLEAGEAIRLRDHLVAVGGDDAV